MEEKDCCSVKTNDVYFQTVPSYWVIEDSQLVLKEVYNDKFHTRFRIGRQDEVSN